MKPVHPSDLLFELHTHIYIYIERERDDRRHSVCHFDSEVGEIEKMKRERGGKTKERNCFTFVLVKSINLIFKMIPIL